MRRAAKGAGVSGLNPKALLLFLAFLPQFLTHGAAWPFAAQIALLGLVHTANCAVVYTSVGATAGRVLRARPAAATAVNRATGRRPDESPAEPSRSRHCDITGDL